jgi:hypothetical protein
VRSDKERVAVRKDAEGRRGHLNLPTIVALASLPLVTGVDREYMWWRPMMEAIGFQLVGEVPWGVKLRVALGAASSMADLLTDIFMVVLFFRDPKKQGYFIASLVSLSFSQFAQLSLVYLNDRSHGVKKVVKEAIPILLGFKPAVDAYRVATGEKMQVGQMAAPEILVRVGGKWPIE